MKYALICEDTVFETVSEDDADDFRFSKVFILEKVRVYQKFKIALVQDQEIIGISQDIMIQ